jgi:hypothetical protein
MRHGRADRARCAIDNGCSIGKQHSDISSRVEVPSVDWHQDDDFEVRHSTGWFLALTLRLGGDRQRPHAECPLN